MKYRPDIDGLRAVAVLAVVLCHAGMGLPGGYVGVDVFFVLSGYLISSLMLQDLEAGTFSLVQFWERRIRRIVPALCVVVAATFICGWFLLVPRTYKTFGASVVNLLMMQSNVFFSRYCDYFAADNQQQPLLHTWSLSLEEQFYLVVPLLFWAAARVGRRSWLLPLVATLAIASFAYSVHGTSAWRPHAYYAFSARAWELLAGVLTALVLPKLLGIPACRKTLSQGIHRVPLAMPVLIPALGALAQPVAHELAAVLGLAGIILPCCFYDATTPFPGLAALPPVLGTVLLIGCGGVDGRATWLNRRLASRPAVAVGLISYSLYLWHWPLIVFLKRHNDALSTLAGQVCFVAASIALAALSYRYVERPFRRGALLATRPRLLIATAAVLLCFLAGGQVLRLSGGLIDRLPEQAQLFARTGVKDFSCFRYHQAYDVPHNLLRVGPENVEPRLLVWGDSHAGAVMPVIKEMCAASGVAALCAMHPNRPPVTHTCDPDAPQHRAQADEFGTAVCQYATNSRIDAVLLVGFWKFYFAQPGFAESLLETVDTLRAAGLRVYFLKDVPDYGFHVADSLVDSAWRGSERRRCSFSREEYDVQNRWQATHLPLLVERGVTILDPTAYLSESPASNVIRACDSGGSFYYDEHHLSYYGAKVVQAVFAPLIDEMAEPFAKTARANRVPVVRAF